MARQINTSDTGKNFVYVRDPAGRDILNGERVTKTWYSITTEFKSENGNPVPGSAKQTMFFYDGAFGPGLKGATRDISNGETNWNFNYNKPLSNNPVFGAAFQSAVSNNTNNVGRTLDSSAQLSLQKISLQTEPGDFNNRNPISAAEAASILSKPNVAQTPPNPDQQSGNPTQTPLGQTPPAPQLPGPGPGQELISQGESLAANQLSIAGSAGLRYPKLMKDDQDKIKFQAVEISPRTQSQGTGLQFEFAKPSYQKAKGPNGEDEGPVVLAIQSSISDQNSVDWGPDTVNALDAALFEASKKFAYGEGQSEIQNTLKGIYDTAKEQQGRLQRYLAGQAASLNNVLARTDNVVLNPNLELLFQGPQLRPFTFTFKMSARNQPEADEIKKIIKYFKYHMAVRKETGLFLRAPHVFTIQYLKGETENHPGINLISPSDTEKACALTNCSVDYTPLGSYMTYEDGTMVAYTLNLQFQELTPIYDSDYAEGKAASHPIGY